MQVVKLNRTHKMFKEYGHVFGLRFVEYGEARDAERKCFHIFDDRGRVGYVSFWNRTANIWCGRTTRYGKNGDTSPYWITFKSEYDLTKFLLCL